MLLSRKHQDSIPSIEKYKIQNKGLSTGSHPEASGEPGVETKLVSQVTGPLWARPTSAPHPLNVLCLNCGSLLCAVLQSWRGLSSGDPKDL